MMIYNITSNVDPSVHEEWLDWMQHEHIPETIATGKFSKARLVKVLVDEQGGVTYAVQFYSKSKSSLEQYHQDDAPGLKAKTLARWGDKVVSFRTELQIISDHKAV